MALRRLPAVKISTKEMLETWYYNVFLQKLEISDFPHAGAIKVENEDLCNSLYADLFPNVKAKIYSVADKNLRTYSVSNGWIHSQEVSVPRKGETRAVSTILKNARERFVYQNLNTTEQHIAFEESQWNGLQKYCEHKVLVGSPAFAPIHEFSYQRKRAYHKPLFPSSYPFNLNKIGTSWELYNQVWGSGQGYTDPWLYVKESDTGTLNHCDRVGSGNIFAGEGSVEWKCVSPNDYGKCRKLYLDRADVDPSVSEYDFILKGSAPTLRTMLEDDIDVFFTDQRSGDLIITKPHCFHSVINNGFGLALARTYLSPDFFQVFDEELQMQRKSVDLTDGHPKLWGNLERLYHRMNSTRETDINREIARALSLHGAKSIGVASDFAYLSDCVIQVDSRLLNQCLAPPIPASDFVPTFIQPALADAVVSYHATPSVVSPVGEKSQACQICKESFSSRSNVLRHERERHCYDRTLGTTILPVKHQCFVCAKSFPNSRCLQQHGATHV